MLKILFEINVLVITVRKRSCGKVMFLHVSFCPQGCMMLLPVWSHVPFRGLLRGVWSQEGGHGPGRGYGHREVDGKGLPRQTIKSGGTHPTVMFSCLLILLKIFIIGFHCV